MDNKFISSLIFTLSKDGKCKGKFQTAFEFYTPEIFMAGDNFGAATKF